MRQEGLQLLLLIEGGEAHDDRIGARLGILVDALHGLLGRTEWAPAAPPYVGAIVHREVFFGFLCTLLRILVKVDGHVIGCFFGARVSTHFPGVALELFQDPGVLVGSIGDGDEAVAQTGGSPKLLFLPGPGVAGEKDGNAPFCTGLGSILTASRLKWCPS